MGFVRYPDTSLLALILFAVGFAFLAQLYRFLFTPLKAIPGPWRSRIVLLNESPARRVRGKHLLQLHQKYGPVVRIGPQLLSVQGTEAIETIYGSSSKWTKPLGPVPLSIDSHGVHGDADLRQMLEPCFSAEDIEAQQHVILNCADTALTVMEIACENEDGKVDILQITRTFAFDVITEILYGGSWQGRGTHSERKTHLSLLDKSAPPCEWSIKAVASSCGIVRRIYNALVKYVGVKDVHTKQEDASTELEKISDESITAYLEDIQCKPGSRRGCLASFLNSKDRKEPLLSQSENITRLFIPVMRSAEKVVDDMCAALTFAIWDLARLPECRKKAAEEIAKFFPSREDMTAEALKALPFLNAFLMESMRYHSVSGDECMRLSPGGGCTVGRYHIPQRIAAICDPYCRARDPSTFPNPDTFDPDRWLLAESREIFSKDLDRSKNISKSLTEIAMRFSVASILFQYEFETNAQSDSTAIEALEQDIRNPWRHKLVLSLTARLGIEDDFDLSGYSIIDGA